MSDVRTAVSVVVIFIGEVDWRTGGQGATGLRPGYCRDDLRRIGPFINHDDPSPRSTSSHAPNKVVVKASSSACIVEKREWSGFSRASEQQRCARSYKNSRFFNV